MNLQLERDHECYCYLIEDLLNRHCWTSVFALYRAFRCFLFVVFFFWTICKACSEDLPFVEWISPFLRCKIVFEFCFYRLECSFVVFFLFKLFQCKMARFRYQEQSEMLFFFCARSLETLEKTSWSDSNFRVLVFFFFCSLSNQSWLERSCICCIRSLHHLQQNQLFHGDMKHH